MRVRAARPALVRVAAGLAAALIAVGFGAPTASADDPLPYLTLSCGLPIWGFVGQPIELSPAAVVDQVVGAAPGADGVAVRFQFGFLAPFQVGQITDNPAIDITGTQIADAVVGQLSHVAALTPVAPGVADAVHRAVAAHCDFTAHALNAATPAGSGNTPGSPGQQGSAGGSPGPAGQTPAGTGTPLGGLSDSAPVPLYQFGTGSNSGAGFAIGTVAMRDYGGIPMALPGRFAPAPSARYGGVPGSVPVGSLPGRGTNGDDLRTAGEARALGPGALADGVGLPLLIAVLALAGVTAALVRTWALRRLPVPAPPTE